MNIQKLNTKLSQQDVIEIKQLLYSGLSQTDIADRFNISQPHVSRIVHGLFHGDIEWPDGSIGGADIELLVRRRLEMLKTEERQIEKQLLHGERYRQEPLKPITSVYDADEDADKTFEKLFNTIREDEIQEFEETITDVGEAPEIKVKQETKLNPEQPQLDWDEVLDLAPSNAMVSIAKKYPELRKPICITFHNIPKKLWHGTAAKRIVLETAIGLGIDITNLKREQENEDD